jgi:hypothetical protein
MRLATHALNNSQERKDMNNKSPSKTDPTTQMPKFQPNDAGQNEGEGNRTADRQYREHLSRHVESGKSEEAAEEARRALEGDEADDLREAEQHGKAKAKADDDTRPRIAEEDEGEEDQRARDDQGMRSRH